MRFVTTCTLLLLVFAPAYTQKKLQFQDWVYEDQVKTVMVFPQGINPRDNLQPAATPLQQQNLILEFDDIQETKNNYYVRLIHCNFDWSKSTLMDLDFITEYNEFPINDYSFSSDTHLPYIHYRFVIPKVKLAGNYLLTVFREGDRDDLILSKRILIYDNRIKIAPTNQLAGQSTLSATNQQINFTIHYQQFNLLNPYENIHVVIRQNQRWDNARMDVKPSFMREDIGQLEYRFFDTDKQWAAGNEFRFVDFRSLNFPGQNTANLDRSVKPFELYVQPDGVRKDEAYSQYRDLNGNYVIENLDVRGNLLTSQYLFVNFTLRTPAITNGAVYVTGNFNQWARNEENKMRYNSKKSVYEASILLKQGRYDYSYLIESKELEAYALEGSHYQTENIYELLVYYTSLQPRADMLIGYYLLPVNPR